MMLIRKKTAQNLCTSIVLSIFANEKRDIWSLENTVNNTYCKINVYISWLMKGLTRESRPLFLCPLILSTAVPEPVEVRPKACRRAPPIPSKAVPELVEGQPPSGLYDNPFLHDPWVPPALVEGQAEERVPNSFSPFCPRKVPKKVFAWSCKLEKRGGLFCSF